MNGAPNVATISGTPTVAGVFNFTVQVNDAANEVATAAFTITVVGKLQGHTSCTSTGSTTISRSMMWASCGRQC